MHLVASFIGIILFHYMSYGYGYHGYKQFNLITCVILCKLGLVLNGQIILLNV